MRPLNCQSAFQLSVQPKSCFCTYVGWTRNQAASIRGFDEDHMSILDAAEVLEHVNRLLEAR